MSTQSHRFFIGRSFFHSSQILKSRVRRAARTGHVEKQVIDCKGGIDYPFGTGRDVRVPVQEYQQNSERGIRRGNYRQTHVFRPSLESNDRRRNRKSKSSPLSNSIELNPYRSMGNRSFRLDEVSEGQHLPYRFGEIIF